MIIKKMIEIEIRAGERFCHKGCFIKAGFFNTKCNLFKTKLQSDWVKVGKCGGYARMFRCQDCLDKFGMGGEG